MGRQTVAIKLTYLVSHPIQYQAPLLRRIAKEDGIDLRVVFEKNPTGSAYFDQGFKHQVEWDIPLTEGYENVSLNDTDLSLEIERSDVLWLHGWGSPVMRKALSRAHKFRVPVLMRGENCDIAMPDGMGPRGWLKRLYVGRILRRCHGFLAIGTENKNYYLQRGVLPEQIFSMPYAIDNDRFAEQAKTAYPKRDGLKATLGIAPEQKVVCFAGKFMPRKHPELLIHAINSIDWAGTPPALVFVGGGELEKKLRDLAPDAHFPGFKNQGELPAIYDMADVMVLPSEREPWGLAINEAMACGTTNITSDQVGCATDLIDDDCGRVFPSGDIHALAEALEYCLKHSVWMGEAAKAKINQWGFKEDIEGLKQAINFVKPDYDTIP